ncbi:DNA polymerase III subunit beta, partial [bacterium]|nr:DNA polymerase III subunit beta [bacterium]
MKLTMARGEMLEALGVANKGLSSRSTLPILAGILVTATQEGNISFQATDLEISVRHEATGLVDQPGATVLPGRLMTEIVRSLPESAVSISIDGDTASIVCGQASFTVKTLNADDFPKFPEVTPEQTINIPTVVFSDLVGHVSKSVSRDETRPILTGVLLVVEGPSVKMVATDSYRLAVKETILESPAGEPIEVVVPARALEEAVKLSAGEKSVTIGVAENQIIFTFERTTFVTRRIEGAFPNYRQLIPKENNTTVTLNTEEFASAVKRVSLMAQHNTPVKISVTTEDQTLSLSANSQDVGDASEDLMAKTDGQDVEIAFNHSYLNEGISAVKGDLITLATVGTMKPGVITAPSDEGFL